MPDPNKSELLKNRQGTTQLGGPYEQQISAFIGIRCVLKNDIKDMWMGSNLDGFGAFDDLVLFIENSSSDKNLFLIQKKHKLKGVFNSVLLTENKKICLEYFEKSFLDVKAKFDAGTLPFKAQCEFKNIKFILFTNGKLTNKKANKDLTFIEQSDDFLNTGTVFKVNSKSGKYNEQFLQQFYLYSSQIDILDIENNIKSEIKQHFRQFDREKPILQYFSDWSQSFYENKIILTKMDIQAVLLDILLTPYISLPHIIDDFLNAPIWNKVIHEFNVVFLNNEKYLSKVWCAIQLEVNKLLEDENIDVKNWNGLLQNPLNTIKNIKLQSYKHFSIKKDKDAYTVGDAIILLWSACKIPLVFNLMDSHSQENVFNAISKLDHSEYKRRYIFIGSSTFSLPNYNVFTNFKHVSETNRHYALKRIRVSLQNRESTTLASLSLNRKSLKEITADIFLDLLESRLIGKNKNKQNYYIPRCLQKPLVSHHVLSQDATFIVLIGNMSEINLKFDFTNNLQNWSCYEKLVQSEYRKRSDIDPKLITIIVMEKLSKKYKDVIEIIKKLSENDNPTVHFLQFNGQNNLEWLYSNQNINTIKPFRVINVDENQVLQDETLFNYLTFNVLSDISGEGKTMLLHYVKDNCPPHMWMVYLNLKDVSEYIKKKDFSNIVRFLFDESNKLNKEHYHFIYKVFTTLLERSKVIIAIDGIDDIKYDSNTKMFLERIKQLDTPTLIATRPSLQIVLEDQFNTLSFCFTPFTKDNQRMLIHFISQKNSNAFSENDITQILLKTSSLGNKLIAIPLQTNLFGRIMANEKHVDITNFDIPDLYEEYIKIQLNEVNSFNNSTLRTLSRLALLQFYQETKIAELFNVQEFYDDVEDKKEIFIKSKIIQIIEENYVIFAHKSLSEFLVARYLYYLWSTSQTHIIRPLLKCLFYKEQEIIRIFFDKIILKDSPLHKAVFENNEELFKSLMNTVNVDSEDKLGRNVLHIVASYGKCNDIRLAQEVSSGVKLLYLYNEKSGNYISPSDDYVRLHQISVDFFRALLKFNLNPHKKDVLFNLNVFEFAIQSGSLEMLQELLPQSCANELETIDKDILLYHCVIKGYWKLYQTITNKNYKIKHDTTKDNLLHMALYGKNIHIVKDVVDNISDIDERNIIGYTPFVSWFSSAKLLSGDMIFIIETFEFESNIKEDDIKIIEIMIQKKANLTSKNILGVTPFHFICSCEDTPLIKTLIKRGAEVNQNDYSGRTPLHFAAKCSVENVKLLIKHGSKVDPVDNTGMTPLCCAARYNKLDTVTYLISKGAKINTNKERLSPLIEAAIMGNAKCVEVLIENGADVNQVDKRGYIPLLMPIEKGHIDCIKLLFKKTTLSLDLSRQALYRAAGNHQEEILDYFLLQGLNMHVECEDGTLLHRAVETMDKKCAQLLLSRGFDINIKTKKTGYTALHLAAAKNLVGMLEYLISKGADVNIEDKLGHIALIVAVWYNSLDCVKLLINNNTNILKYRNEALECAEYKAHKGYREVFNFLKCNKIFDK